MHFGMSVSKTGLASRYAFDVGAGVVVPQDFLGMCFIGYPNQGANPVGVLNWKSARLGQMVQTRWSTIETSAGVYSASALAVLDDIITFQRQNGATVYFGLYGTPAFYASSSPNPTYGDNITKGPWGAIGECANPTSLSAVADFCTMLINRYNKAGGAWYDAYGETLGKGIQYWETWNEPNMDALGNRNATGSGASGYGFFWGTPSQLVDLAYTQYAAIKAADSSVIVSSPGFNSISRIDSFLATTGGTTGKTGPEAMDALCSHPYSHGPIGHIYGVWTADVFYGASGVRAIRDRLYARGVSVPLWFGEWGVDASGTNQTTLDWYAAAPSVRYNWMARFLMTCAALGIKRVDPWHWQQTSPTQGNSGWWQGDVNGVTKAYNDFAANSLGKTIVSGSYKMAGDVRIEFSDSTSWQV